MLGHLRARSRRTSRPGPRICYLPLPLALSRVFRSHTHTYTSFFPTVYIAENDYDLPARLMSRRAVQARMRERKIFDGTRERKLAVGRNARVVTLLLILMRLHGGREERGEILAYRRIKLLLENKFHFRKQTNSF